MSSRSWVAESPGHPLDQGAEGVDGQPGLGQVGRLLGQVEGGQLEEAEGMVGDDHLGRGAGQLLLHLGQLGRQLLLGRLVGSASGRPAAPAGAAGPGAPPGARARRGLPADGTLTIGCPKGAHWATLRSVQLKTGSGAIGPHPATAKVRPGRSTAVGRALLSDACPFRVKGPNTRSDAA